MCHDDIDFNFLFSTQNFNLLIYFATFRIPAAQIVETTDSIRGFCKQTSLRLTALFAVSDLCLSRAGKVQGSVINTFMARSVV